MKTEVYEKLKKLYDKYGAQEFGKLCQKFLAIAFKKAGYRCVAETERAVQGIDIEEAERGNEKYSIEVKTSIQPHIVFEEKDVDGLRHKKQKGYQPILAALKFDILSNWVFAKADKLKAGKIHIDNVCYYRVPELEKEILPLFDEAVKEHYSGTMQEGQNYLNNVLKRDVNNSATS